MAGLAAAFLGKDLFEFAEVDGVNADAFVSVTSVSDYSYIVCEQNAYSNSWTC